MNDDAKAKLESIVNRACGAIGKVIEVFAKFPKELDEEVAAKAFAHLRDVIENASSQALVARQTAGSFSLDSAEPPSKPYVELSERTIKAIDRRTQEKQTGAARGKPEGRMVGTKEIVFSLIPEPRPVLEIGAENRPDPKTGGIKEAGFLDAEPE